MIEYDRIDRIRDFLEQTRNEEFSEMSEAADEYVEDNSQLAFIESISHNAKGSLADIILDMLPLREHPLIINYRAACHLVNEADFTGVMSSGPDVRRPPDEVGHKMRRYAVSIQDRCLDIIKERIEYTQVQSKSVTGESYEEYVLEDPVSKFRHRFGVGEENRSHIANQHLHDFAYDILHLGVEPL